ncbi:MAG: suppressor of fused domain protein [Lachnospiraceae bacterium]|nr:suppressor of fused domain protein [Lachnospiraceae bacterium]
MNVPKEAFPAAGTAGWDAIVAEFERIYPGQRHPKFFKAPLRWINGGKDPFDGILVYDGGDYWHFVGLGLSELYGKVTSNPQVSGWGVEYTFKLKKGQYEDEEAELKNVCEILQSRARDTMNIGEVYQPYQYVYTGQTSGIDFAQSSNLTGFISVPDASVNGINTPNGEVQFIEFVGVTTTELSTMSSPEKVQEVYALLGTDITDYGREAVV